MHFQPQIAHSPYSNQNCTVEPPTTVLCANGAVEATYRLYSPSEVYQSSMSCNWSGPMYVYSGDNRLYMYCGCDQGGV